MVVSSRFDIFHTRKQSMRQFTSRCQIKIMIRRAGSRSCRSRTVQPEEFHAWRGLIRLREAVTREIDERLRREGDLSLADYGVLITLVTAPGLRLRMGSLGTQRMLTPSGITRVVTHLEKRGLVRREPDRQTGAPRSPNSQSPVSRRYAAPRSSTTRQCASSTSGGSRSANWTGSHGSSRRRCRASSALPPGRLRPTAQSRKTAEAQLTDEAAVARQRAREWSFLVAPRE